MKIQVTQKHIDAVKSRCGDYNSQSCPAALALQEATGAPSAAGRKFLSVGFKLFPVPQNVLDFIDQFDGDRFLSSTRAKPFEFELPLEEAA